MTRPRSWCKGRGFFPSLFRNFFPVRSLLSSFFQVVLIWIPPLFCQGCPSCYFCFRVRSALVPFAKFCHPWVLNFYWSFFHFLEDFSLPSETYRDFFWAFILRLTVDSFYSQAIEFLKYNFYFSQEVHLFFSSMMKSVQKAVDLTLLLPFVSLRSLWALIWSFGSIILQLFTIFSFLEFIFICFESHPCIYLSVQEQYCQDKVFCFEVFCFILLIWSEAETIHYLFLQLFWVSQAFKIFFAPALFWFSDVQFFHDCRVYQIHMF